MITGVGVAGIGAVVLVFNPLAKAGSVIVMLSATALTVEINCPMRF